MLRQAGKDALAVMPDPGHLAMHYLPCFYHAAAKSLANRLVAKADAQQGNFAGQALDQPEADSCLARRAGPGGDNNPLRRHARHLIDRQGIVAEHAAPRAELAEVLHQVVGEGVVVVDHEEHAASFASGAAAGCGSLSAAAFSMAALLCRVSCHSAMG